MAKKITSKKLTVLPGYKNIHNAIVELLENARRATSRSVNIVMSATYWEIGRHLVKYEQSGATRAEYGTSLIERLSADLTARFGRGYSRQNLQQMRSFYLLWPREKIRQTVSGKFKSLLSLDLRTLAKSFPLPWSAYVSLMTVKDQSARTFYETEAMRAG